MKKLTREMLIIEPSDKEQDCKNCPFYQDGEFTCQTGKLNAYLVNQIDIEFVLKGDLACDKHSITLKPEYNGLD